jgi:SNF2 family DNA or RNA helicase
MSVRYNMVQIKRLHESLLEASSTQLLSDNQRAVKMLTDQKGKSILDNFIMLKINESQIESLDEHNMCKSFMDEAPDKLEKKSHLNELKFKNLKLIKNQLLCKNWLLQAFVQNRNVILADEKGLGKTVTLLVFLNHLKSQYKIDGPFLVITSQEKLEHWRHLAEKWTSLKTLVYYDSDPDLQKGLAQLRKWVFFKKRCHNKRQVHGAKSAFQVRNAHHDSRSDTERCRTGPQEGTILANNCGRRRGPEEAASSGLLRVQTLHPRHVESDPTPNQRLVEYS